MHAYAEQDSDDARDRAFERIYRLHAKDVYRYSLALLRNPADAEDVTQTTFLNAYRAFKRGEEPHKPHHWLIKIAHNVCRSRYVRIARRPTEVPLDESLAHVPAPTGEEVDVRELLAALGELPFRQRAALVMRELDGRSYREIAETLDVTVPAVETLIFRARRRLRADRGALRSLALVPLPPSLASWLEGGTGALVGGGAIVGSGLVAKAVLLLLAGVVAGTVATKGFDASASPDAAKRVTAVRKAERPASHAAAARVRHASAKAERRAAATRHVAARTRRAGAARATGRAAHLPPGAGHAGTISTAGPGGATPPAAAAPSDESVTPSAPATATGSSRSSGGGTSSPPSPTSAVTSAVSQATAPVTSAVQPPPEPTSVLPPTPTVPDPTSVVPPPPPLPKVP